MKKPNDANKTSRSDVYDRALRLMQHHDQAVDKMFGTFLLAEAVILGFIGTVLVDGNSPPSSAWIFGGSIFGMLLIIPWWSTFHYAHTMYLLRINQAIRLERNQHGKLLSEAKELSDNGKVCVNGEAVVLRSLSKLLPPRRAYPILMFGFFLAFLFVAVASWPF